MKETCRACKRMVDLVDVGGSLVAADPEVIKVIGPGGPVQARRVHAEMCSTYAEQGRRSRLAREQRAFSKRRNHGL